jgi:ubiquitin carboxyl-terminal hydrolase 25/28
MMFGEWTWIDIEGCSCLEIGKQHDVSECMDNCMFQIETALLKFDEQASTDSNKMSIVKRCAVPHAFAVRQAKQLHLESLFYGKMHQRITALPIEASSQGKATVNEKEDLFSHLPVNVSDEGYDLYDGLGGYFYDTVEFEGKKAIMDVSLVELPPILQIQLQVRVR